VALRRRQLLVHELSCRWSKRDAAKLGTNAADEVEEEFFGTPEGAAAALAAGALCPPPQDPEEDQQLHLLWRTTYLTELYRQRMSSGAVADGFEQDISLPGEPSDRSLRSWKCTEMFHYCEVPQADYSPLDLHAVRRTHRRHIDGLGAIQVAQRAEIASRLAEEIIGRATEVVRAGQSAAAGFASAGDGNASASGGLNHRQLLDEQGLLQPTLCAKQLERVLGRVFVPGPILAQQLEAIILGMRGTPGAATDTRVQRPPVPQFLQPPSTDASLLKVTGLVPTWLNG